MRAPSSRPHPWRGRILTTVMLACALLPGACTQRDVATRWPSGAVRLVVPFGTGASTDLAARLIAPRLAERWGQPVVVDNRPGGDGMAGAQAFITARDPNALLFSPVGIVSTNPVLHTRMPFDPATDLVPVAGVVATGIGVAVPARAGVSTLAAMATRVQSRRSPLLWSATAGLPEVVARALIASASLDERYVPYAELSSAVRDLGEGRLDMLVTALPTLATARGAGRVHVLAVATAQRSPAAPDVPTLREAGFPTLAVEGPQGLFGGRGLDTAQRRLIALDVAHVMSEPALVARLSKMGFAAAATSPEGFAAAIAAQRERVRAFLALAGGVERLRR